MIDSNYLSAQIQSTIVLLDPAEFPATYGYLSGVLDEEGELNVAQYNIANTLLTLDKPLAFPDYVVDLITELFEAEIAEGNADAMNDLGAQYYGGYRGFAQSYEQAIHYYKLAAQNGSRQAQENLGYCYYYGRDGVPDYEKAFHYFALGAFDGHLISLYKIGDMYLNGYYVEKNESEAFHIYLHCLEGLNDQNQAAVAGPVYLRMGRMFLHGLGTEQDAKAALICYQKAESFLYDMVVGGEEMYRGSLRAAVKGQEQARAILNELL